MSTVHTIHALIQHPQLSRIETRYLAALAGAVSMTFALFVVMQIAIKNETIRIDDPPPTLPVDIVRLPEKEVVEPDRPKVEPPPTVEQEPPPAAPPQVVEGGTTVGVSLVEPSVVPDAVDPTGYSGDGQALPLVRVAPDYPQRAARAGIEGWVIVEFMIDRLGRVREARVIQAEPANVFDAAALKAVLKYKYKPQVQNGSPVEVTGVRQRIVFDLS